MATVGAGDYIYDVVDDWAKLPEGMELGMVSSVATDKRDRVVTDGPGQVEVGVLEEMHIQVIVFVIANFDLLRYVRRVAPSSPTL